MDLNLEVIKNLDNEEIYNILKPITEEIYRNYMFVNMPKTKYNQIVYSEIEKSKIKYDGKTNYKKYMKRNISTTLFIITKHSLKNNIKSVEIISNYINNNFLPTNDKAS